ncbi:MAG: chitobiase/beta-hexosaminidase C-terminal domain-containing protein, partial [Saprospiraceae bacterium]|nr:chitobiase/beta-hexosaminidase C-terminal domain-containing protein [Saprospiraceae bacterium]
MTDFFSHLHPLLVHLPIGILLAAFVLEAMARWMGQVQLRPAVQLMIGLGLTAAVLSAGTGWLLGRGGGYDQELLTKHQYWGFGTVAIFGILWWYKSGKLYLPLLVGGTLALVVTGHFGGGLTHGEAYLFESESVDNQSVEPSAFSISPETKIFAGLIQPIFESKCVSCHRPEKKKGKLLLTDEAGIRTGGEHGNVLTPGLPDSSLLMKKIYLPKEHDDHMPPAGKPQLTELEIKLLAWWIESGADFQSTLKDQPLPESISSLMAKNSGVSDNPVFLKNVAPANSGDIQKLRSLGAHIQQISVDQPWLSVSFAGNQNLQPAHWEALRTLKQQIVDIDFSHVNLEKFSFDNVEFPHLVKLNLSNTSASPQLARMLKKSNYLEHLNITNTRADQSLLDVLPTLTHLRKLFIWQTGIQPETFENWKKQFPNLKIYAGAYIPDDAPMTLRPPKLKYGRSFFDDTAHVELDFPFKGVEIYYTLDEAASPTTQSSRYQGTIVLDQTSHIRAFAAKKGWTNSSLVDAVFVKKKLAIRNASLATPPSPKYPAKGA